MNATLERLQERRRRGDEGGFTLIELLIVIVILAILAAIVVFAVQNLTGSSAKASCRADFKTVETGVEAYKAQMGAWPLGGGTLTSTSSATATDNLAAATAVLTAGATTASVNAAAVGASPLLTASDATPNLVSPSGTPVGPWLKDAPVNNGHYTIFVSNDGKGTEQVLDANNKVTNPATGTAADCNAIN